MSNKLAPMIKKVEKTTIKLTPLDIPHNDYLADIFEDREEIPNDKNLGASNSAKNIDENNNDTNNEYNDNYLCKFSILILQRLSKRKQPKLQRKNDPAL